MRSLEITSRIQERLKAHLGDDLPSLDSIKVFEGIAVSTKPLRKPGSIWDKGSVTRLTLREMADWLNAGNQVPLHTLHKAGYELPVGRLFYAEVRDLEDGGAELRVLLYLDKSQDEIITSIETGVIESMSIGLMSKQILCSECGWDYLGDDADFMNLYERKCGNGHIVGQDGVHVRASGLDLWSELSLVSLGASTDAAIVSRSKARLSSDEYQALAASGTPPESLILVATEKGQEPMETKEFMARLEAQAGEVATLTAKNNDLVSQLEQSTADLAAANSRIEELENAASNEGESEVKASLSAAQADLEKVQKTADGALEFLQDQVKKARIAAGQSDPEAPDTIDECIAAIDEAGKNLVNLFDREGTSVSSDAPKPAPRAVSAAAFKTPNS